MAAIEVRVTVNQSSTTRHATFEGTTLSEFLEDERIMVEDSEVQVDGIPVTGDFEDVVLRDQATIVISPRKHKSGLR